MQIFKTILMLILIGMSVSGCKSKTVEEAFYKNHKKESREIAVMLKVGILTVVTPCLMEVNF
ncbi:hypothetical protein P5G65_07150 [Paenibacillus chondroitinus]|uniref:Lipoprotein n=1 Tax=Paenibacillus chondroitinus TaxID=59842 RepID=A0ABU6D872_9BACL|nr:MULTISPECIES: hypothetical protein [Paenibacillus]MCY9661581.1 hypothetical protein [Paenibacillus anseongense]MEB4793666.1 hypothetical protein [Paenibacillus chondroitinus]